MLLVGVIRYLQDGPCHKVEGQDGAFDGKIDSSRRAMHTIGESVGHGSLSASNNEHGSSDK